MNNQRIDRYVQPGIIQHINPDCEIICNPNAKLSADMQQQLALNKEQAVTDSVTTVISAEGFCSGPKGKLFRKGFHCAFEADCKIITTPVE